MRIPEFAVKRPVSTTMMILIFVVLGITSYFKLPVDMLPSLTFPNATVVTRYEGVGPEEIERSVTKLIEGAVSRVEGLKKVSSTSRMGASIVNVEFEWGTNMDWALQNMREKMDQIPDYFFPKDAKKPIIFKFNPADMPLLVLGLSGKNIETYQLRKIGDDYIKDQLEAVDGVAACDVFGGPLREILISVDSRKLAARKLNISQIVQKLSLENVNISSGEIKEGYREYLVRALGEFSKVEEMKKIVLGINNSAPVYLEDVADVYDTHADLRVTSRSDLDQSATLIVLKQSGVNTVEVSNRAWEKIKELEKHLPRGVKLEKIFDQADYIKKSIGNVRNNALQGGFLAIIILYLFLMKISPTAIIAFAIPISLLTAFIPIFFQNMTLNLMSMGGLALAVGMLVDNSIVVLENIYRRMHEYKEDSKKASMNGVSEVGMAITASTLTTVVVFIPIAFTTGIASRLFRELALTVTYSLCASLIIAFTLVPLMASRLMVTTIEKRRFDFTKYLKVFYHRLLTRVLKRKVISLIVIFAVFVSSLFLIPFIGREFMPTANDVVFEVILQLPRGTRLEETDRIAKEIETISTKIPEVTHVHSVIGIGEESGPGSDVYAPDRGFIIINLKAANKRKRTLSEIVDDLRQKATGFQEIEKFTFVDLQSMSTGGASSKPIEIKIFGKDLLTLNELSERLMKDIKDIKGLKDLEQAFTFGNPELQIVFDREKLARFGMTPRTISDMLEASIKGTVATRFREKGEEADIRVRLKSTERTGIQDIRNLTLTSPSGITINLSDVGTITRATGPGKIIRENQMRKASLLANYSQRDLGGVMDDIKKRAQKIKLHEGYFIEYGGSYKDMQESYESLAWAFLLALLLVYMIMAASFESLLHPFTIMFAVPFSIIGILIALFVTRINFSVNVLIGVIMLAGIVVNNGIVLVDYINQLRQRGTERTEAILIAGQTRLRPILMTTLTTVLGLLPMVIMGGEGSEIRRPLAVTVISGLSFGTILTLLIVPVIYTFIDDFGNLLKKLRKKLIHR